MMCRLPFRSWPPGCGGGVQAGACWVLLESSVVGDLAGGAGGGFSFPPLVPYREDDETLGYRNVHSGFFSFM